MADSFGTLPKLGRVVRPSLRSLLLVVLCGSLLLTACAPRETNTTTETEPPAATDRPSDNPQNPSPKTNSMTQQLPRLQGKATVNMVVDGKQIVIEVDGDNAPITAGNFVDLVNKNVYDGLVFHRVVKDPSPFVAQGGDPQGKDKAFPVSRLGAGSYVDPATKQPRLVPLEIKLEGQEEPTYSQANLSGSQVVLKHRRGAVAMARSQAPDSASAQFYFALADLAFLDGNYAVFGYVTQGMDVVDRIKQGDRITSATVTQGLENLKN